MKIKVLLLLVSFSTIAIAQSPRFGVKGGINYSTIRLGNDFKYKTGFVGGVFAIFNADKKLQFQTELLYSQEGGDVQFSDTRINYIIIPAILKYNVIKQLSFQGGLQFGVRLSYENDFKYQTIDSGLPSEAQFYAIIGMGYNFSKRMHADLRYNYGLGNAFATDNGAAAIFSFAVGYTIF